MSPPATVKGTAPSYPADVTPAVVTHAHSTSACGLTSQAAQDELQKVGPNSMPKCGLLIRASRPILPGRQIDIVSRNVLARTH